VHFAIFLRQLFLRNDIVAAVAWAGRMIIKNNPTVTAMVFLITLNFPIAG
jgi:hypothetical protein